MENETIPAGNETAIFDNATDANAPEPVKDPEAVLRKNRELLAENAKLKTLAEKAKSFDFDAAMQALDAQKRAEEEKLAKRGEYEKLIEQKTRAYEERIEAERRDRARLENTLKHEKLANVLVEKGVLADRVQYLVKELADSLELNQTETGFTLRKTGGVGDATEFDALIEDVRQRSPFFFAANLTTGTGGFGSTANGTGSAKKWADLTRAEKTAAIRDANGDLEAAQKKYR